MGFKKMFKTKPPSQEEVEGKMKEKMMDRNLPVKQGSKKPSNFQAYSSYANDLNKKKVYAPKGYEEHAQAGENERVVVNSRGSSNNSSNPYGSMNSSQTSSNPYANVGSNDSSNPYGNARGGNAYGSQRERSDENPYGSNLSGSQYRQQSQSPQPQPQPQSQTPYGGQSSLPSANSNPYVPQRQLGQQRQNSYAASTKSSNPYAQHRGNGSSNPYRGQNAAVEEDLNYSPLDSQSVRNSYTPRQQQQQQMPEQQQQQQQSEFDFEDLNADVVRDEQDSYRNQQYQNYYEEPQQELTPEQIQEQEEEEEIHNLKYQIRDIKQDSVASTRNIINLGLEAEESGKNTAGMIGAQSEILFNVEKNLSLAETQDKIAKDKVKELHHYNRSLLKPSMANPFTKSRKLRLQEQQIKNERIASKVEQESQRRELAQSTNRIKSSLNDVNDNEDSVTTKYKREKWKEQAKRYQFEADSEDEEMEMEIAQNMDEISKISGRLKKLAVTQSEEIDRQNYRIRDIEEKTDKLDINVHLNTASLARTR